MRQASLPLLGRGGRNLLRHGGYSAIDVASLAAVTVGTRTAKAAL